MNNTVVNQDVNSLPSQYRPLSPWAYFGYNILFAIPLVGFISLIVLSFNDTNINRRNYARSFFCVYILAIILFFVVGMALSSLLNGYGYYY